MKLLAKKPEPAPMSPKAVKFVECIYRIIVIALLASILAYQIAILNRFSKPIDVNVQNSIQIHKNPFAF